MLFESILNFLSTDPGRIQSDGSTLFVGHVNRFMHSCENRKEHITQVETGHLHQKRRALDWRRKYAEMHSIKRIRFGILISISIFS